MRNIIFIGIFGLIYNLCNAQVNIAIAEKRNTYNEKANYYFERNEYKKAIIYYNLAFQKDASDYFSVLKKAEAYAKLKLFPQAEECYRTVFETNQRIDNAYRLKYALVLLANNKQEEFKKWLTTYNQIVDEEIKGENYIVSKENRIKMYKDSTIILVSKVSETNIGESTQLKDYKVKMSGIANESTGKTEIPIEGFTNRIFQPAYNSHKTLLYFISDAPGGKGGMDLYSSHLVNGKWTSPKNMGIGINTKGNEVYPFIVNDSVLYFSSDAPTGFGGLDIYKVNSNDSNKVAINLGKQVNTASDDFGISLDSDGQSGFFTSANPGVKGSEIIYSLGIYNLKMKYAAYQPKRKNTLEDNTLNILLSTGEEYNIASTGTNNFVFSFQPMENYKLVIQKENIEVKDIVDNKGLTDEQKRDLILNPAPLQKAEIKLQAGMKYQFSAGQNQINSDYKSNLKEKAGKYQKPGTNNIINLTALAKELHLSEGEIYTIRFVKDNDKLSQVSNLYLNDKEVKIYGQSLFLVFPQKTEINFNIQTDIEVLDQNYSSKKYALTIDEGPVFKKEEVAAPKWLLSLAVNTDSIAEVKPDNRLSAKEISIIPGTEYILTLSRPDAKTGENKEIVVPLTKGVKYNLSSSGESNADYKKALAEFLVGREGLELLNEEVIDISVLSKEIEVQPDEDLSFTLIPAKQLGKKQAVKEEKQSTLTLDGKDYQIGHDEKYTINVPFNPNNKLNLQTDLDYVQQNFAADAYILKLDTTSFTSEIAFDSSGYIAIIPSGWLCMSVNTDSIEEVEKQDQFTANDVSIITGKEYILTVSKVDAVTKETDEIIVPLLRNVKYDFTSNPDSEEEYKKSIDEFMAGRKDIETIDGTVIDITLLSKELKIEAGDEVSFSLLPVKKLSKNPTKEAATKSSLYLDNKVIEFTNIQKYTINMPLNDDRMVNLQTNIEHLQENFEPSSFTVDVDTIGFFSEIAVDTTGYKDWVKKQEAQIKDPVFDIVTVNFNLNEYALSPEAKKTIQDYVIDELKGDSRLYVTIKGYTDALGDASYNLNLSKNRAESVKAFLKSSGIGDSRIRTLSFGATQLLGKNINWKDLSEAELRKYRKVEIVIYLPK